MVPKLALATLLTYEGREQDATAILDDVGESLPEIEARLPQSRLAATALYMYHSLRGDPAATRHWVEVHREKEARETKGDRYVIALQSFEYAEALANAGLDDEAIAELRTMLEAPGGRSFVMVDAHPAFERLKGSPGYESLRAAYGGGR